MPTWTQTVPLEGGGYLTISWFGGQKFETLWSPSPTRGVAGPRSPIYLGTGSISELDQFAYGLARLTENALSPSQSDLEPRYVAGLPKEQLVHLSCFLGRAASLAHSLHGQLVKRWMRSGSTPPTPSPNTDGPPSTHSDTRSQAG